MKNTERKPKPLAPENGSQPASWNGEKCRAQIGTVIVGRSLRNTWWCANLEGTRRKCVRVEYRGEVFFLDDEGGGGSYKVFKTDGGPWSAGHKSLPVDDEATFENRVS